MHGKFTALLCTKLHITKAFGTDNSKCMCQLAAPVSRMMKNYQKMTIVMPVVQEGLKRCIAILLQVQVCELSRE